MILDRRFFLVAAAVVAPLWAAAPTAALAQATPLQAAIDSDLRKPKDKARDVWRHPEASLLFWGLKPGLTVIEVDPGGGWYTDILAPYLKATHGRYIATAADLDDPSVGPGPRKGRASFEAKYQAHPELYGDVTVVGLGPRSGPLAPAGSVDLVLIARETHNWTGPTGLMRKGLADIYAALKPGGVLAIEDHRAPDGADPTKGDGYISEAYMIDQAKQAGFTLAGRSEINANPKDTKDYPFGVWTLPPTRQSAPDGQPPNPTFDHSQYDAIGESDRMTLKFVKPG